MQKRNKLIRFCLNHLFALLVKGNMNISYPFQDAKILQAFLFLKISRDSFKIRLVQIVSTFT